MSIQFSIRGIINRLSFFFIAARQRSFLTSSRENYRPKPFSALRRRRRRRLIEKFIFRYAIELRSRHTKLIKIFRIHETARWVCDARETDYQISIVNLRNISAQINLTQFMFRYLFIPQIKHFTKLEWITARNENVRCLDSSRGGSSSDVGRLNVSLHKHQKCRNERQRRYFTWIIINHGLT